MTNKKLTDNEIIKALECCVKETHTCLECPYTEFGQCEFLVMKDALNLINRLQADYENYKQVAENQQKATLDKSFEVKRLREQVNRLQAEIRVNNKLLDKAEEKFNHYEKREVEWGKTFKKQFKEIERLNTLIAETNKQRGKVIHAITRIDEVKAEAYKEFAERVKEKAFAKYKTLDNEYLFEFNGAFIDNILKELVGEDNESKT